MTNEQRFKTADERFEGFKAFCKGKTCEHCPCKGKVHDSTIQKCILMWLDLKYWEELKNCPFCGSAATIFNLYERHYVSCVNEDCIASVPMNSYSSEEDAISAWNRRA